MIAVSGSWSRRPVVDPVEAAGLGARQDAQRRPPGFEPGRLAASRSNPGGKKTSLAHGVEQDLLRVEACHSPGPAARAVDPVGVVAGASPIIPAQPAMPHLQVLFTPRIQAEFEERAGEVVLGE